MCVLYELVCTANPFFLSVSPSFFLCRLGLQRTQCVAEHRTSTSVQKSVCVYMCSQGQLWERIRTALNRLCLISSTTAAPGGKPPTPVHTHIYTHMHTHTHAEHYTHIVKIRIQAKIWTTGFLWWNLGYGQCTVFMCACDGVCVGVCFSVLRFCSRDWGAWLW